MGLFSVVALSVSATCAHADELDGRCRVTEYSLDRVVADGGRFCQAGTTDRHGMVYFSGDSGVIRFDGARWRLVCNQPMKLMMGNDDGFVYGATIEQGDVFRMAVDGPMPSEAVSLRDQLVAAGLLEKRVNGFRDISRVGHEVYLTQTWFIARCRIAEDGTDDIKVFSRKDVLPKDLKFRRVFNVDGRPMVQLESMTNMHETKFGWFQEDGQVEIIEGLQVPDHVVSCVDFKPEVDDGEFYCAGYGGLYRIQETEAHQVDLGGITGQPSRTMAPRPDGGAVLLLYPRTLVTLGPDGSLQSHISDHSILNATLPMVDAAGRVWVAGLTNVSRIDIGLNDRHWELPNNEAAVSLAVAGDTLVVCGGTGAYFAKIQNDRWQPFATPFVKVPGTPNLVRNIRTVDTEIFMLSDRGTYIWNPDEPHTDAQLLKQQSSTELIVVDPKRLLVGSNRRLYELTEISKDSGKWSANRVLPTGEYLTTITCVSPAGDAWVSQYSHAEGRRILRIRSDGENTVYPIAGNVFRFEDSVFALTVANVVLRYDEKNDAFAKDDEFNQLLTANPEALRNVHYVRPGSEGLLVCSPYSCRWKIQRTDGRLQMHRAEVQSGLVEAVDRYNRTWSLVRGQLVMRERQAEKKTDESARVVFSKVQLANSRPTAYGTSETPQASQSVSNNEDLLLAGSELWRKKADFRANHGTLTIACSLPMVKRPETLMYSARMVGLTDSWTDPTYQDTFQFPALPWGNYSFEVKAKFPTGEWSETSTLAIVVRPRWYESTALRFSAVGTVVALALLGFLYRMRSEQKKVRQLQSLVEQKERAERELLASQADQVRRERLSAFGEMAASIAHDVGNILSPVSIYSELISEQHVPPTELIGYSRTIYRCVQDVVDIISRLHPLYRIDDTPHQPCDIEAMIEEVLTLLKASANSDIEFLSESSDAVVTGSPVELREILLNLGRNACDAIQGKGTVSMRCHTEKDQAIIVVQDDGTGMPDDVLAKCTDTFFTSKGEYGTGLGLAITNAIVTSYGGALKISSEVGKGTAIQITLPVDRTKLTTSQTAPTTDWKSLECRVALVDDIEQTRTSVEALLRSFGVSFVSFSSPELVLEYLQGNEPIDLLLTDYQMPRINGSELCHRASQIRPDLRTIITSGHEPIGVRELCDAFLPKPITIRSLREALSVVLTKKHDDSKRTTIFDQPSRSVKAPSGHSSNRTAQRDSEGQAF